MGFGGTERWGAARGWTGRWPAEACDCGEPGGPLGEHLWRTRKRQGPPVGVRPGAKVPGLRFRTQRSVPGSPPPGAPAPTTVPPGQGAQLTATCASEERFFHNLCCPVRAQASLQLGSRTRPACEGTAVAPAETATSLPLWGPTAPAGRRRQEPSRGGPTLSQTVTGGDLGGPWVTRQQREPFVIGWNRGRNQRLSPCRLEESVMPIRPAQRTPTLAQGRGKELERQVAV